MLSARFFPLRLSLVNKQLKPVDHVPDGHGSIESPTGNRFEGTFESGKAMGFGCLKILAPPAVCELTTTDKTEVTKYMERGLWKKSFTYEGEFTHGKPQGLCVCSWFCPANSGSVNNGYHYEGFWSEHGLEGCGTLIASADSIDETQVATFHGYFQRNRMQHGTLRLPSGVVYAGEFDQDVMHGQGSMQWFEPHESFVPKDGQPLRPSIVYTGKWANGVPNGMGVLNRGPILDSSSPGSQPEKKTNKNSESKSESKSESPSSPHTTMLTPEVLTQSANFPIDSDASFHSKLEWSNGASYEGSLLQGEMEGFGRFCWGASSGKGKHMISYSGQFKAGEMHGRGCLKWMDDPGPLEDTSMGSPSGRGGECTYTGEFQNNQLHGQGILRWPDGSFFSGSFRNGQYEGKGRFQQQLVQDAKQTMDCLTYDGAWTHGLIHGHGRFVGTGANAHFTLGATFQEGKINGFARITSTLDPKHLSGSKSEPKKINRTQITNNSLGFYGLMQDSCPKGHGTLFFTTRCSAETRKHLHPSISGDGDCLAGSRVEISGRFEGSFLLTGGGKKAWLCPHHACSFFGAIKDDRVHGHGLLIVHAVPGTQSRAATVQRAFLGNWELGCFGVSPKKDTATLKQVLALTPGIDVLKIQVSSHLHDIWREPRKLPETVGGRVAYEPRIKVVNGKNVDIANLGFTDLPSRFQGENLAAAESAVGFLVNYLNEQYRNNPNPLKESVFEFPAAVIEKGAEIQHKAWLDRNGSWAPAPQKLPYVELDETEKAKDRQIVQHTAKTLNDHKTQMLRSSLKQSLSYVNSSLTKGEVTFSDAI